MACDTRRMSKTAKNASARPRRRRDILRINARVDVLEILDRCVTGARQLWATLTHRSPDRVSWDAVPVGALVVTCGPPSACDGTTTTTRRLLVRRTPDTGAFVGVLRNDGSPSCDDDVESETWLSLGKRRGSVMVLVLARRVPLAFDTDAHLLEEVATRGLRRAGVLS